MKFLRFLKKMIRFLKTIFKRISAAIRELSKAGVCVLCVALCYSCIIWVVGRCGIAAASIIGINYPTDIEHCLSAGNCLIIAALFGTIILLVLNSIRLYITEMWGDS